MSKYRCNSCMIWCEVIIPDPCDFKPVNVCLAGFKNLEPEFIKEEEEDQPCQTKT